MAFVEADGTVTSQPDYSPPDAATDPAGVLSQLLGDLAQLRGMLLGVGVQIETLEKRIERLESGGY